MCIALQPFFFCLFVCAAKFFPGSNRSKFLRSSAWWETWSSCSVLKNYSFLTVAQCQPKNGKVENARAPLACSSVWRWRWLCYTHWHTWLLGMFFMLWGKLMTGLGVWSRSQRHACVTNERCCVHWSPSSRGSTLSVHTICTRDVLNWEFSRARYCNAVPPTALQPGWSRPWFSSKQNNYVVSIGGGLSPIFSSSFYRGNRVTFLGRKKEEREGVLWVRVTWKRDTSDGTYL